MEAVLLHMALNLISYHHGKRTENFQAEINKVPTSIENVWTDGSMIIHTWVEVQCYCYHVVFNITS